MDLDWLVRDQGDSRRGRGAFLQNRSDRSYPLPSRLQDRSYKSIPPKEQQELGDRHILTSGDLRRALPGGLGSGLEAFLHLQGSLHIISGESSTRLEPPEIIRVPHSQNYRVLVKKTLARYWASGWARLGKIWARFKTFVGAKPSRFLLFCQLNFRILLAPLGFLQLRPV